MSDLKPCPARFLHAETKIHPRVSCRFAKIFCVVCDVCGVHTKDFDTEIEAKAAWNHRPDRDAIIDECAMVEAQWFYYGDDTSSEKCRFSIDECITEDFEYQNKSEGSHVLQVSGARPVPDMWVALRYFTEQEKDERQDDEDYVYTVHSNYEEAKKAMLSTLKGQP